MTKKILKGYVKTKATFGSLSDPEASVRLSLQRDMFSLQLWPVVDNQTFYISVVSVKDVIKETELMFFHHCTCSPPFVLSLFQGSLFTFTFEVKSARDDHWKKKFTEDELRKWGACGEILGKSTKLTVIQAKEGEYLQVSTTITLIEVVKERWKSLFWVRTSLKMRKMVRRWEDGKLLVNQKHLLTINK